MKSQVIGQIDNFTKVLTIGFIFFFLSLGTGFNVETIEYKNISFTVWDVGGQDKVLSLILVFFVLLSYMRI